MGSRIANSKLLIFSEKSCFYFPLITILLFNLAKEKVTVAKIYN